MAAISAHAQEGHVIAKATHGNSGEPFKGVLISVDAPQYHGRRVTGPDGIVRRNSVPAGTWDVEFRCPSDYVVGRIIKVKRIIVMPGEGVSVNVEVPQGHCHEPAYSEIKSEFRGYIFFGFELSRFTPCDAAAFNLSQNTFTGSNNIWASNIPIEQLGLKEETLYYTEFKGTLAGPGRFGHFGIFDHEVVVEEVNKIVEVDEEDCNRHHAAAQYR
jgi:hypothetical protein